MEHCRGTLLHTIQREPNLPKSHKKKVKKKPIISEIKIYLYQQKQITMKAFIKTLKENIKKIETAGKDSCIELEFEKSFKNPSRGDITFYIEKDYNYLPPMVKVIRQRSKFEGNIEYLIEKRMNEMTKQDWSLFYSKASEMERKTKLDVLKKVWMTDFIYFA